MKIAVVNYDELNPRPSKNAIIGDICRLFQNSSKERKEEMGQHLCNQLSLLISAYNSGETDNHCIISFIDTTSQDCRNHLMEFVDKFAPDLLVSYNLAGFELSTLADSLLYNLIDCRQFHIIKKKNLPNENRLTILRSINLFLFSDCKEL